MNYTNLYSITAQLLSLAFEKAFNSTLFGTSNRLSNHPSYTILNSLIHAKHTKQYCLTFMHLTMVDKYNDITNICCITFVFIIAKCTGKCKATNKLTKVKVNF